MKRDEILSNSLERNNIHTTLVANVVIYYFSPWFCKNISPWFFWTCPQCSLARPYEQNRHKRNSFNSVRAEGRFQTPRLSFLDVLHRRPVLQLNVSRKWWATQWRPIYFFCRGRGRHHANLREDPDWQDHYIRGSLWIHLSSIFNARTQTPNFINFETVKALNF